MNRKDILQTIINCIFSILLVSLVAGAKVEEKTEVQAQDNEVAVSTPTSTPQAITEVQDTPESYIRKVFGSDAPKAFLLLQGNGEKGSCAENRQLNPKAVNDNRTWGGVGRDVNIFQINDVYHPVVELNLENDWKANIRYAKRMFDRDGGTFSKRWTCGKYYNQLGYDI